MEFLCNREQRIRIDQSLSNKNISQSGVPQGLVLRQLIFFLFIWDLRIVDSGNFVSILKCGDNSKVLEKIIEEEDVTTF